MKQSILRLLGTALLVLVPVFAAAQSATYTFNAADKFSAGNKTFEPGRYELQADGAGGFILSNGSSRVRLSVVTRLAQADRTDETTRFVFDVVEGGERMLSEIWVPGQDGYLVCTLNKAHKHQLVHGQKK